jgi:hypothetical protein
MARVAAEDYDRATVAGWVVSEGGRLDQISK